jgi:hypothetical protein
VLAEVDSVRPGRVIRGDAAGLDLYWVVVALKVKEVLNGALEPSLNGKTEVEFAATFDPGAINMIVEQMRTNLPTEPAIWLIKWEGEFRLTKPLPPGADPAAVEAASKLDKTKYVVTHLEVGVFAEEDGKAGLGSRGGREGSGPLLGPG